MCEFTFTLDYILLIINRTSGKVDIQSIVSCHNRIKRTASLVGIETPGEKRRRQSFTDSDYTSSTSDSDS